MKTILSKPVLILVSILLAVNFLRAQSLPGTPPAIAWQKCLGGSGDDVANSVRPASDGGFIISGTSDSNNGDITDNHGQKDFCLLKLDEAGNLTWEHSYGGSGNDEGYVAVPTSDGGYAIAGKSNSKNGDVTGNHGSSDVWLIKTNDQGTIQWQKSYGGSMSDAANAMQLTSDGGFVLAGLSYSSNGDVSGNHGQGDAWIIKVDQDGTLQWQKAVGGSLYDIARDIDLTSDGGYIVTGYALSNNGDIAVNKGQEDFWFFKLDANGNLEWETTMGGTGGDCGSAGVQTIDGGYVFCGLTHSKDLDVIDPHGDHDMWVIKADADGIAQWTNCIGGSDGDNGIDIKQQTDGTIIASGYTSSNDGDVSGLHGLSDIWLTSLDESGNLVWQETLGGSNYDYPRNLQIISPGQYLVAGAASSNDGDVTGSYGNNDFWIIKLSADVCSGASATITYTTLDLCGNSSITLTASSGTGLTYQWQRGESNISGATNKKLSVTTKGSYKVVVINAEGCSKTSAAAKVTKSCKAGFVTGEFVPETFNCYPNPSSGQFTIDLKLNTVQEGEATVEIINSLDQRVYVGQVFVTHSELNKVFDAAHFLNDGTYILKVIAGDQVYSSRLMIAK